MPSKSTISPTVSQPASRTRSTTPRTSSTLKATCRSPGRFAAGAGSPEPAGGEWKRTTSNTSLPSGARAITISTVAFSRPMIRSIHSPLNTPGSLQSKPSSVRNRTVSSRSSTTRPTRTKLVTPGRRLSTEVKAVPSSPENRRERAQTGVDGAAHAIEGCTVGAGDELHVAEHHEGVELEGDLRRVGGGIELAGCLPGRDLLGEQPEPVLAERHGAVANGSRMGVELA